MKVHDLYRSVRVKALEVCEALTAVEKVRGMSGPSATIDEIVTHFTTYRLFPFEVDIQKDTRRHVKLLYADYCTLRDELIKLLQTDVSVASQDDRAAMSRRASELRAEGMTLKEIGVRLTMEGYQTRDGGIWHPATVLALLRTQEDAVPDGFAP